MTTTLFERVRLPPLSLNARLRYDVVQRILARTEGIESVLEIGAGNGGIGARLAVRYEYVGVEPDRRAWEVANARLSRLGRGRVLHGDVSAVQAGDFDLVCAFEVLEHIEDDREALETWRARLKPGGLLLLSVPASARRYGASDRAVGHFRRYDAADLEDLLGEARFSDVSLRHYGFPLGYLLLGAWSVAGRLRRAPSQMDQRSAASGRWFQPPETLGWVTRLAAAPFRYVQRPFESRWGTGLVAVARRRDSPAGGAT